MAKNKKNKSTMLKRRLKKLQKKSAKRATKRANEPMPFLPPLPSLPPDLMFPPEPMADIEAPEGFRPITTSQAMMRFGEPIMEAVGNGIEGLEMAMAMVAPLWNMCLDGNPGSERRASTVRTLADVLEMPQDEAEELVDSMVDRKQWLLPPEIQPADKRIMFIRKETLYEITPFDEADLGLSGTPYVAEGIDEELCGMLRQLDEDDWDEYEDEDCDWEEAYSDCEVACSARFDRWLESKNAGKHTNDLKMAAEVYFRFIYYYGDACLADPTNIDFDIFFSDHIFRKVHIDSPNDVITWPVALKLFYDFLGDIGFAPDSALVRKRIEAVETDFIEALRKLFG